jgi:protein MpaA
MTPFDPALGDLDSCSLDRFESAGRVYDFYRCRFVGPRATHEPIRIGLFAGVHGDEPAGSLALVQFLEGLVAEPVRAAGYELFAYPWVNPTGAEDGTRENRAGKDLNREFWRDSGEPEVKNLEKELVAQRFQGLITLHADDTSEGHYGYAHGQALEDALLRPALLAAEKVLPRDRRSKIDGFTAREGVINECFKGILSGPPNQRPRPFNLIFETPAHAPIADQVAAHVAALDAILATYRGFITYGQDL